MTIACENCEDSGQIIDPIQSGKLWPCPICRPDDYRKAWDGAGPAEDRRWAAAVEANGVVLIRALQAYGYPVSDAASTANMSIEARNLHNAARRFIAAFNSTGSIADEPAMTNGQ